MKVKALTHLVARSDQVGGGEREGDFGFRHRGPGLGHIAAINLDGQGALVSLQGSYLISRHAILSILM